MVFNQNIFSSEKYFFTVYSNVLHVYISLVWHRASCYTIISPMHAYLTHFRSHMAPPAYTSYLWHQFSVISLIITKHIIARAVCSVWYFLATMTTWPLRRWLISEGTEWCHSKPNLRPQHWAASTCKLHCETFKCFAPLTLAKLYSRVGWGFCVISIFLCGSKTLLVLFTFSLPSYFTIAHMCSLKQI